MTIQKLCQKIELPKELTKEVLEFEKCFDFSKIRLYTEALKNMALSGTALNDLKKLLAADEKNVKMLTCMLYVAVQQYEVYQKKGIGDSIYFDTMRAFSRFCEECKVKTGIYAFDREWWTVRQIGMVLFRIGALEYEMVEFEGKPAVSIHIPSDADISEKACDASLKSAGAFFQKHYPVYADCRYICDSWLLSPELTKLLPPDSRILQFQKRFSIFEQNPDAQDVAEWVFKTNTYEPENFPEDTSLQKNMKRFLLSGQKVGVAFGELR